MKLALNTLGALTLAVGVLLVALGATVLTGWHSGLAGLVQVRPEWVPVQYNTALAFVLSGGALLLFMIRWNHAATGLGLLTALIGLITLGSTSLVSSSASTSG